MPVSDALDGATASGLLARAITPRLPAETE
jgi:hypothetical protein